MIVVIKRNLNSYYIFPSESVLPVLKGGFLIRKITLNKNK